LEAAFFAALQGLKPAIVWFAADEARMAHFPYPAIHYWSIKFGPDRAAVLR